MPRSLARAPLSPVRQTGVGLVEPMIGLLLASILVIALAGLFGGGLRTSKAQEDRLQALTLAEREIELVRGAAALGRDTLCDLLNKPEFNRSYQVDGVYDVDVRIDPDRSLLFAGQQARLGEAIVRVRWDRGGTSHELTLSSLIDRAYY